MVTALAVIKPTKKTNFLKKNDRSVDMAPAVQKHPIIQEIKYRGLNRDGVSGALFLEK